MDVRLRVASVSPASAFPPTAKVMLDAPLVNVGYSPKELVLGFAVGKQYHYSTVVKVDAGESENVAVQVPFDSPGTFGILAEVHSTKGKLLYSTTLQSPCRGLTSASTFSSCCSQPLRQSLQAG